MTESQVTLLARELKLTREATERTDASLRALCVGVGEISATIYPMVQSHAKLIADVQRVDDRLIVVERRMRQRWRPVFALGMMMLGSTTLAVAVTELLTR